MFAGAVVAELIEVAGQVVVAGVDSRAPGSQHVFPLRLAGHFGGGVPSLTCDYGGRTVGGPCFGFGGAGFVEGVGGGPDVLGDVYEVQQDVDRDAVAAGLGTDQNELVACAVDRHDPRPQMLRLTCPAWSKASEITCSGERTSEAVHHLFSARGAGRAGRSPLRPPGGWMTSCEPRLRPGWVPTRPPRRRPPRPGAQPAGAGLGAL